MGIEQDKLYETRQRRLLQILQTQFDDKQTALADAIDRSSAYVSFLLADKNLPHHKNLGESLSRHIEIKLGLPKGWLDGDDNSKPTETAQDPVSFRDDKNLPGFTLIRRRVLSVVPGSLNKTILTEEQAPALAFRTEWLEKENLNPENLVIAYMNGDNMETRIQDGDTLLIDTKQTHIKDGQVYAVRCGDSLCIKRIFVRTLSVILQSDNDKYPKEELSTTEAKQIQILGKVVWVSGAM